MGAAGAGGAGGVRGAGVSGNAPLGELREAARRSSAHVFVERLSLDDRGRLAIAPGDAHHLARVLRLRPGEPVSAGDGNGAALLCTYLTEGYLQAAGEVIQVPPPAPPITIGMALCKGDRIEWATQKLTEIGADRIVFLAAERNVVHWEPERGARHLSRLNAVARQAAMQSRRWYLPALEGPKTLAEMDTRGALAEPGGSPPSLAEPAIFVGPEGGWSEREIDLTPDWPRVELGQGVLRTETAAVAAGVLLNALRAGSVAPR